MCDTIIATPTSTAERTMLFGKNSDRQRNEAQALQFVPRVAHSPDEMLNCTYISVPQVAQTHAVLLSRPFWTWGAEMGANEHGVVIGNEGLHARGPAPQDKALIGMDLLRLALERSSSAAEAVEVIATLLERHGQGGNCGHLIPSYYHNSFMIADRREAFVMETVNREWLLERVRGVRAISNEYSIGTQPERCSRGLSDLARELSGGVDVGTVTDYAEVLKDPKRAHIGSAGARRARATALLTSAEGRLRTFDLMRILRDHDTESQEGTHWNPRDVRKYSLCLHAAAEDRGAQTTAAMVSEIRSSGCVHWVTGTSAPCISIFKPVLLDVPLPDRGPSPTGQYDSRALWWRHERLHRLALRGDLAAFIARIEYERDTLERYFGARIAEALKGGNEQDQARVVVECWTQAGETEQRWLDCVEVAWPDDGPYAVAWDKMSRLAGLELPTSNSTQRLGFAWMARD